MQSQLLLFPSLRYYGLFCIDSCHASPFQFQVATFKKVRGHIQCTLSTHLHTVVTHSTVGAARGSVEVARGTPLHPKLDSPNLDVLIKGSTDVIVLIFILVSYERKSK